MHPPPCLRRPCSPRAPPRPLGTGWGADVVLVWVVLPDRLSGFPASVTVVCRLKEMIFLVC